mgnify:FL=1
MNHHIPILCDEIIEKLIDKPKGIYMDCTVGFGGHAEQILNNIDKDGFLIGLDIDPYALNESEKKLKKCFKNYSLFNSSYIEFPKILNEMKLDKVDGFLFDLGISSYQVDATHRGFSFMTDGPLDMRFNQDKKTKTAKDLLYTLDEENLCNIIKIYGEEKYAKRIAKNIIKCANEKKLNTTFDLKNAICQSIPSFKNHKSLARVFQAIRIAVNNEIEVLKQTLKNCIKHLSKDGRIAIITFHSIEDRIVKHFFKDSTIYENSSYNIEYKNNDIKFELINKKPITPSKNELNKNSRSRSAKLRVAKIL